MNKFKNQSGSSTTTKTWLPLIDLICRLVLSNVFEKWYKKLLFHLLNVSVLNSYILHKQKGGRNIRFCDFRLHLIRPIIEMHGKSKAQRGRPSYWTQSYSAYWAPFPIIHTFNIDKISSTETMHGLRKYNN